MSAGKVPVTGRLAVAVEVAGLAARLALYVAIMLYAHEFSAMGKQVNEVRRLVEERCR